MQTFRPGLHGHGRAHCFVSGHAGRQRGVASTSVKQTRRNNPDVEEKSVSSVGCPAAAANIRLSGDEGADSDGADGDGLNVAPAWLRWVAIGISTSLVAITELIVFKRALLSPKPL